MPKKVKYRKMHRGGKLRGVAQRGASISFGSFGIQTEEAGLINSRQIESARRAMTRHVQRGGKIWIRIFPDKPMTKKGENVGMGKGKGAVDHYVAPVLPGRILFEMDGVSEEIAREAMRLASHKLCVKTKFVKRD